jgi:hypothetical protein
MSPEGLPSSRPQRLLAPGVHGGALFSPCMAYRYWLSRLWDPSLPLGVVLGINPSTAAAEVDDQTTVTLIGFGRVWGWGGYYLGNPFAFRARDQRELLGAVDPVGPDNDDHLRSLFQRADQVVVAWGSAKTPAVRRLLDARLAQMADLLGSRPLLCLGRTKDGSPRHPLMLSYETTLEPWRRAA